MAVVETLRSTKPRGVSEEEWQVRVDLAACYRLVAHYGWDDVIATHISARVPGRHDQFLINPYGLMFEEITASSLVKIDVDGNKLSDSPYAVNPAGFTIHSAVHMAREDAGCVVHLHTTDGVAVSAMACGVLPIAQSAMTFLHDLAYHEFEGPAFNHEERARLQADLGARNRMMLRNHGTMTLGRTVAEAFLRMYSLEKTCSAQTRALAGGPLHPPSPEAVQNTVRLIKGMETQSTYSQLAWPALLRMLDRRNPGYRD